jgi:flavin reductase (DIM6/NTAB) family NADH-FMN oxidoreductase RutF
MEPSELVAPPRVAGSPASLECTLHSTLELGDSTLVLGNLVAVSVADDVLVEGHPAYDRLDPLTRLGRDEWGVGARVVTRTRPSVPDDIT